jgi:hypothetical protein
VAGSAAACQGSVPALLIVGFSYLAATMVAVAVQ